MDSSDLDRFFTNHWNATVEQCEKSLEPDDLEQKEVLEESGTSFGRSMPYEIALIEPTFGHLRQFANIFESQLGLSADFFWGIIGLLLKLTAQDSQALSRIPRMLKSLGYKAEAFKGYCAASREVLASMKEACFDIQIQLVEFFTSAVKSMRGEEEEEEAKYN
ncbi:hypothetical protein N0V84_009394 [Fusarium piperis]|uniref:Uncharacterized protein n=1 Tax=Fusarium piperis TaxID=1435070 RepID=A0A9W8W6E8_9HYPO|nr:hypothetical protein N0V84_009394 [Fusarium piperis]